jgi:hypothetical protein
MIQPTMRGLESPAASAMSPYVDTRPAGIEATSERTVSTCSSVTAATVTPASTVYG